MNINIRLQAQNISSSSTEIRIVLQSRQIEPYCYRWFIITVCIKAGACWEMISGGLAPWAVCFVPYQAGESFLWAGMRPDDTSQH